MSANSNCDMLDSSITKSAFLSSDPNKIQVATEFYQELNSVLNSKPPISKEKVNKIVREALKSHRYYKHVVYYVENFIKTCPADYKLSGLYVIDALIRKHNSNTIEKKKHQACVHLYTKRFSANICKTFTNLFLKSPQSDRSKINRVIELWQKYNVIEHDLIDKLNRISNTSKIDIALSEKSTNNSDDKNNTLSNDLDKPDRSADKQAASAKKLKPSASPNKITKTEISKILEFDKDFDSDSDNQSSLKRKSTSPSLFDASNPTSIFQSTADRLQNSISNCTAWLQTNSAKLKTPVEDQNVKLADFVPPLLMSHYSFANTPSQPPPPPPPPAPVPPPPKVQTKSSPRERERERQRRGLPPLKDKHLCICSKTIWLGHLSKATNEDIVIDEIIELLSPSSSNDSESMLNKKRSSRSANSQNIIVDVHLIPPRGCAFVEFFDRKTASKCLDKMRDNYRLDGNYIKVAWATNKGIEKEKRLKEFWNVDVGCTYIPWQFLDSSSKESIDLSKWANGGIVDEDSLPEKYLTIYKSQMLKMANSDSAISTKASEDESKNESNDMDICTDDNQTHHQKQSDSMPKAIQPIQYQNMLNSQQVLPINFSAPPPSLGPLQSNQILNSSSSLSQNQIGLPSFQVHPINYQALSQFNPVFPAADSNQESLVTTNQNLIDLFNSQRNLVPLANFPSTPPQFQFFHRPILMNPQNQNHSPMPNQPVPNNMRKILLPFHGTQGQMDLSKSEQPVNQETNEITSTTQNEDRGEAKNYEDFRNPNYRKNSWKSNNNYSNKRRSYGHDYQRNNYTNNSRFSNQSGNFRNYKYHSGQNNLDRK